MNDSPVGTVDNWSKEQWVNFEIWLETLLRQETVEIIFTKADGSERVMRCTKNSHIIDEGLALLKEKQKSEELTPTSTLTKTKNSDNKSGTLVVWDVDVGNWRSFRVQRLVNILTLIMKYDYQHQKISDFFN